jgi:hypothetical protein
MTINESLKLLYKMAREEKDLRHKRYLLCLAQNLDDAARKAEAQINLRNLVKDAERILNKKVA